MTPDENVTLLTINRAVRGRMFTILYVANDDGPYIVQEIDEETEKEHRFGIQLVSGSTGKVLAHEYFRKPKPVDELLNIIIRGLPSSAIAKIRAERIARDIRDRYTVEEREHAEDDEL